MSRKLLVVHREETSPGCGFRGPEVFIWEKAGRTRAYYAVFPGSDGAFSQGLTGDAKESVALERFAHWFWSGKGRMPAGWRIARRKDLLLLVMEFTAFALVSGPGAGEDGEEGTR
jgi:hypothetical protein